MYITSHSRKGWERVNNVIQPPINYATAKKCRPEGDCFIEVPLIKSVVHVNKKVLCSYSSPFTFFSPLARMESMSSSVIMESLEEKTVLAPWRIMESISSLPTFWWLSCRRPGEGGRGEGGRREGRREGGRGGRGGGRERGREGGRERGREGEREGGGREGGGREGVMERGSVQLDGKLVGQKGCGPVRQTPPTLLDDDVV